MEFKLILMRLRFCSAFPKQKCYFFFNYYLLILDSSNDIFLWF